MKKLLYLLFAITLIGCSSDEVSNNDDDNEPNLLVSSINYTSRNLSVKETFTYDGKKIIGKTTQAERDGNPAWTYDSGRTEYFYANNKISRTNHYDNDNILLRQQELLYDPQGRLVSIEKCFEPNNNGCDELEIESFSYNDDGSITSTVASDGTTVYQLDNNGNIISMTDDDRFTALIYDNQKAPFKNLTGASNIFYSDFSNAFFRSFTNNCLSFVYTSNSGDVQTTNWTYDYNDAGYPRNILKDGSEDWQSDNVTQTIAIEYFE